MNILLIDGSAGIYVPQVFAHADFDPVGVDPEDMDILKEGPYHEYYWEAWDNVLRDAVVVDPNGNRFTLEQEGDLWAIPE